MSTFADRLERLRAAVNHPGYRYHVPAGREDLIELLHHFDRLDEETRSLTATNDTLERVNTAAVETELHHLFLLERCKAHIHRLSLAIHGERYDWNADPESLTRVEGDLLQDLTRALAMVEEGDENDGTGTT